MFKDYFLLLQKQKDYFIFIITIICNIFAFKMIKKIK